MDPKAASLVKGINAGQRRALARAITRIESELPEQAAIGQEVLEALLPKTGGSLRIGISGVPGVGKSTFIEALGMFLLEQGKRVAVLAVDPSSPVSGGSILGDKTRMESLAKDARAFIRPSPTSGTLGGVARRTRETLLLCEAAGFDVVLVETVGVGQSEAEVASMIDTFLLLMLPGGGDELQGVKRGILELTDVLVVNKADGDFLERAKETATQYRRGLHLCLPRVSGWSAPVVTMSGLFGDGLKEVWELLVAHRAFLDEEDRLKEHRDGQAISWMWSVMEKEVLRHFVGEHSAAIEKAEAQVRNGKLAPTKAVVDLLKSQ
ncbi:MAG: methylmalonyl Co-A mutase-associated GTPase MeaB [Deltaproteobacteria bacterium]|nr:methylmalonyl Co-A mutase-associated GTPase MeaB [Deltaproteobacteria bacterium]